MTRVCLQIQNILTDSIAILVKISKLQDKNAYLIQQLLNSEESFYLDFTEFKKNILKILRILPEK